MPQVLLWGTVLIVTASPATKVQGTLVENLTVVRREDVAGEDDKRVCPNEEAQLCAPPPVIVDVVLRRWRR